jgi:putative nucleotidyltransferase with HDIG domain
MGIILFTSAIVQLIIVGTVVIYFRRLPRLHIYAIIAILLLFNFHAFFNHFARTNTHSVIRNTTLVVMAIAVIGGLVIYIKKENDLRFGIRQLNLQHEIDNAMLIESEPQPLLRSIVARVTCAVQADAGALILPHNGRYTVFSSNTINAKLRHCISEKGSLLISNIIESNKPLSISKIDVSNTGDLLKELCRAGYKSLIGAPITNNAHATCALTFFSKRTKHFTAFDTRLITAVSDQIHIAIAHAQLVEQIQKTDYESVHALVEAVELRDPYTRGHSNQVAHLSVRIAKTMGFSNNSVQLIEYAGLLHDVGKIAVPEIILQKTTTLTHSERAIIKKHAVFSAKIIESMSTLQPIRDWILHHHERWDGKGYPTGQQEKDIPLESRILAVCDSYSAMTGDRPYRQALSPEQAQYELRRVAGSQLDPEVVQVFLDHLASSRIELYS